MRTGSRLGLTAGLVLAAGAANAATTTSTFQSRITLTATCIINSTATLDFGTTGVLSANVDQTTTVAVQCTNTTPYNVGLDAGSQGGTVATRLMKGGPTNETIQYRMYSDSGRTTNWGNTVGTDTVAGTGNGSSQSLTIYGRVPVQTTPTPGNYTDTVTVTVTY
jgi:spore coat protein U-like protein